MKLQSFVAALLCAAVLPAAAPAHAGDGHDHGDAPAAATGTALPRFAAVSESFELVGVLSGKQLVLYLDRFSDNSPVRNAQIELEIGGAKFKATTHGEDAYELLLAEAPTPGVLPVTATVTAGQEVDLLVGELDIHEAAHADEALPTHSWKQLAGWAGGGIAALVLLMAAARRMKASRRARIDEAGAAA